VTAAASGDGRPRIVAIADSDSYVKWAAALLGSVGERWDASLLILETPLVVSEAQRVAALRGSGLASHEVERVAYTGLLRRLAQLRPDAVLVAARGPLVRVLAREVAGLQPRPVIITGLPGISIPATRKAIVYRAQCDLFIVHSHREVREFTALAERTGFDQRFALATLPFARGGVQHEPAVAAPVSTRHRPPTDLVFATQARVPATRPERLRIARLLVRAAEADPSRRVVVKLRAADGEQQTHVEHDGYRQLLSTLGPLPPNLVMSTASMGHALASAEGLVTVSSTAAIEAMARGIPVIALDMFGVSTRLINETLADAHVLGGEEDVVQRRLRHPAPYWRDDNYFHSAGDDDWEERGIELVSSRRAGALEPRSALRRRGGALRDAWERKVALGHSDASAAGTAAYVIGLPLRALVRLWNRARRLVAPKAAGRRESSGASMRTGVDRSAPHAPIPTAMRTTATRTPSR
jgi:hypothetical protein